VENCIRDAKTRLAIRTFRRSELQEVSKEQASTTVSPGQQTRLKVFKTMEHDMQLSLPWLPGSLNNLGIEELSYGYF
jgi:hypothetical protein